MAHFVECYAGVACINNLWQTLIRRSGSMTTSAKRITSFLDQPRQFLLNIQNVLQSEENWEK